MKTTNIPIKKHTKVRYPMSRWKLGNFLVGEEPDDEYMMVSNTALADFNSGFVKVTDISTGLENPLITNPILELYDKFSKMDYEEIYNYVMPKPKSLWQKLTNKLRRK